MRQAGVEFKSFPDAVRSGRLGVACDHLVDRTLEPTTTDPERPVMVVREGELKERAQRPGKPPLGDDHLVVHDLDPARPFGERVANRPAQGEVTTQPDNRVDLDDGRSVELGERDVPDQLVREPGPDAELRSSPNRDHVVGLRRLEARGPPRRVIPCVAQQVEDDIDRAPDEPAVTEAVDVASGRIGD